MRHLTTIDDALDVYFEPNAVHTFNAQFSRYESHNATHGMFWFWINASDRVVTVALCFTI